MSGFLHKCMLLLAFIGVNYVVHAQTLPVGTPILEDYYRRMQLMGQIDSTQSFAIRPLTASALQKTDVYHPDDIQTTQNATFKLLPAVLQFQYTSDHPVGWNDGPMIPNVGIQTYLSTGIYASSKWFSVQLQPEFVWAQNKLYRGFNGQTRESWQLWYSYTNNIDMPERFGSGSYTKLLPGQSSIRIHLDPVSLGLSTENLWWGPGIRNSLLMSNTASGFPHLTLNTTRPVGTELGSFEGQLVAGRLSNSGYTPTPLGNPRHYDEFYEPKPDNWRYFSGFIITYQPKWLTGLSIGASRTFVVDHDQMGSGLGAVLPFFRSSNGSTSDSEGPMTGEQRKKRDEYKTVFARWLMPKGNMEFYVEYGRNDPGWNSRDRFVEMDHSRAYVFGLRKLVPIRADEGKFIDVGLELTQLDRTRTTSIRTSPTWYISDAVRNGYTHMGQMLGAGIGPAGSLQSLNIAWVHGLKKIGVQLERQEHQLDFFYEAVAYEGDFRRNWVDISANIIGNWDYKQFIFFGNLWLIKGLNYQYQLQNPLNPIGANWWNFKRMDRYDVQANIGMMYRF